MPYTPDTPPSGTISTQASQDLTTYQLHQFTIGVDASDVNKTTIEIIWSQGYLDGGTYKAVMKLTSGPYTDASVVTAITTVVTPGLTRFDEIKNALWELLLAEGVIGAGTIT